MAGFVYPNTMLKASFAVENCPNCGLHRNSRLPLFGQGKKKILLLFDKQESIQQVSHTYGVGDKYSFIKDLLSSYNIYTDEDCWVSSVVQCYGNTELHHAECCYPLLVKTIKQLKPELVIAFGEYTPKVVLKPILGNVSVDQVHGFIHTNRELNCRFMFTYSPHANVKGKRGDTVDDLIIQRDVHNAINALKTPFTAWKDEAGCVHTLNSQNAVEWLKNAINDKRKRYMAFDYETNSLRPYNDDSKVLCVSVADSIDNSVSFMLDGVTTPVFQEWLRTDHIAKIAHNSSFERVHSIVKLKTHPVHLTYDTMLMAHVIDNRDVGWLSIKFLAKLLLGTPEWEANIKQYFEGDKKQKALKGSYAINDIAKIPKRQLLLYCGIDSLVEFRVATVLSHMITSFYDTFPIGG